MLDAAQIRLKHTLQRITESIELGNPLNPPCKFKFPCNICNKNVTKAQKSLTCNDCGTLSHIKCDGTPVETYEFFTTVNTDPEVAWSCLVCNIKSNHQNFPFTLCDYHDLVSINMNDRISLLASLPSCETLDEISQYPTFCEINDIDDNDGELITPELLTTAYHTVHEYQSLELNNRLNIFHSNVDGWESKFDTFGAFRTGTATCPDLIGITETSEQKQSSFISNIKIQDYKLFNTPTNLSKGGCCIYVNEKFDSFERDDLKVQNNHFQSTWAEMKNKKSKNIIFGCMYRSPNKNNDIVDFFDSLR